MGGCSHAIVLKISFCLCDELTVDTVDSRHRKAQF
jgi:hypothetical protein